MSNEEKCCSSDKLAMLFGSLVLRLWLAVRAIQTGLEKYSAKLGSEELVKIGGQPNDYGLTADEKVKVYGTEFYHGVPESMMAMFGKEPLMPKFMLPLFDKLLGPALIVVGVLTLLGLAYRCSLLLMGLIYIGLTWGLVLLNQSDGVAWLGTHMIMIAMALVLAKHDRLMILKKW